MAFKKTIPQRLFRISRFTHAAITNCRVSSPCAAAQSKALYHLTAPDNRALDLGDDGIFRRYIHHLAAAAASPGLRFLPSGEKLLEKLREMDIARQRNRLDSLRPPPAEEEKKETPEGMISVKDAVKILKLSQLEAVKSRLRQIEKDFVSYPIFLEVCAKDCSNVDQGLEFAKMLDQSGSVIVLGNIVFLRPEQEIETMFRYQIFIYGVDHTSLQIIIFPPQGNEKTTNSPVVVKAIQGLIPVPTPHSPDDPRMKELQEMEKRKLKIDSKAKSLVQRELWCGLGYLIVQTAAFMRLTFWELSWDVMEPICFYVTSIYFMGGYAFFLRTSKEPSFEGFYQSRFGAKQKRLMKAQKFDVKRYDELKKACYPCSPAAEETDADVRFSSSSVVH